MHSIKKSIAIYGGTFDPVHYGHINTARFIQDAFEFDRFYFLPCKTPLLKNPASASAKDRIEMLKIALAPFTDMGIDTREIVRETPSYMIETLGSIREEQPDSTLTLILGQDAFMKLNQWFHWRDILKTAHIIVMQRALDSDMPLAKDLSEVLQQHKTENKEALKKSPSAKVYFINAGSYDISSSAIRNLIAEKKRPTDLLPPAVLEYIMKKKLYQLPVDL